MGSLQVAQVVRVWQVVRCISERKASSSHTRTSYDSKCISLKCRSTSSSLNFSQNYFPSLKGRTIRKVMGGKGGDFSSRSFFFSLSNSLYEFFLGHSMNIFLGLIGMHEFFSFNFPLREYFFFVLRLTN